MATITNQSPPRSAPGPRGHFFWGNYHEASSDPAGFSLRMQQQYGDVVRLRSVGGFTWHQVTHPEDVEHVLKSNYQAYSKGLLNARFNVLLGQGLLISEGSFWLRQRRLMQPAFHRQRLARLAIMMTDATEAMLMRWHSQAQSGNTFNVAEQMMQLTFQIVAQALFSTDIRDVVDQVEQPLDEARRFVMQHILSAVPIPLWVPTLRNRRYLRARNTLDALVYRIIAEHRAGRTREGDLLTMLLEARDEETGEGMSDQQLRDEVMTLLLAGHETTAVTLSWIWYLLAQHPVEEARLHAELDAVLGGRPPVITDLVNMPYTKQVIDEALRLYPPASGITRQAKHEDTIRGYRIPAKGLVSLSQYATHRHPAFWDNPEVFDPERFTPQRAIGRPPFAYFPFGGGPRQCIGNQFALLEAQLILATIAQHYRLVLATEDPVEHEVSVTLRPRHGVLVRLVKR